MDQKDGKAPALQLPGQQQAHDSRLAAPTAVHGETASTPRRTPSRSTSPRLTRSATTPVVSTSQNPLVSPLASREVSPIRPSQPTPKYSTTRVSRSRKNSTDQSPQRTPSHTPTTTQSVPSAAAVQRALAAVGDKKLPSPTASQFAPDSTLEPRKTARGSSSSAATPARLTSPPSLTRTKPPTGRTTDTQPSISANLAASKSIAGIGTIQEEDDNDNSAVEARYPARGGSGSKLETVREDGPTQLTAMPDSTLGAQRPCTIQEDPDEDNPDMTSSQSTNNTKSSATTVDIGSGSDEASTSKRNRGKEQAKSTEPDKAPEVQKPAVASRKPSITQLAPKPAIQPRRSFQHLNSAARNREGSVKSMTVETETISNPDLIAGDRDGRNTSSRPDGNGSLRTKASTDTIRPRREKKRVRKAPNIANGTASTKADIFEAKVASAVDEAANSSDSEETFVYESNPPEPRSSHRNQYGQRYHHSRTPSTASMASQADNHRSNHFGVSGKKSMKFVNANQLRDPDDEDSAYYPSNTVRSSHRHHHHLARLNRMQNQQNDDSEANSLRSPRTRQYNSWRTQGPRPAQDSDSLMSAMADKPQNSSMYDLSHGAEADDEFTPLLNNRSGRNDPRLRRGRMRGEPYQRNSMRSSWNCAKYTCLSALLGTMVALVVFAVVLCDRTLFDVHVTEVRNVLASEQELFLEFAVTARNPNLVDISVAEGNLDLFAKSKYVGTTEMWRDGTIPGIDSPDGNSTTALQYIPNDNVDDGTDPIEEPGSGTHTMLLGQVLDLDSPLVFESSPFNHDLRHSSASLRLGTPGNKTEEGGSRRWENVMQHPFELVVRGSLKYFLPLSGKPHYMPISTSTTVIPDKPIDENDPKRNDTVRIRERRGQIEIKLRKRWQA